MAAARVSGIPWGSRLVPAVLSEKEVPLGAFSDSTALAAKLNSSSPAPDDTICLTLSQICCTNFNISPLGEVGDFHRELPRFSILQRLYQHTCTHIRGCRPA